MKTALSLTTALGLMTWPAAAQTTFCNRIGNFQTCNTTPAYQSFGGGFAEGYLGSLNVASRYAMVNAYREAHGLPRCHWGLIGALKSAADGLPMC